MRLSPRTTPETPYRQGTTPMAKRTLMRRTAIGLGAALLALSGTALSASTAAAVQQRAAVPDGEYCGPQESFYGSGQYTYGQTQACLEFTFDRPAIKIKLSEVQYYWGGAWYYATADYPARVRVAGEVNIGTQGWNYDVSGSQGASTGSLSAHAPSGFDGGCGTYSVTMTYHQNGPYWTDASRDIDSGQRTYSINVPCS
ncbi:MULTISPECIES: hypothetical protein [Streptomyces]|uniref:hypothetical protein n=1 Tax=Streptomyces TaxID=1883 RepID=UPI00345B67DF